MNKQTFNSLVILAVGISATGLCAAEAEAELSPAAERGRWTFSAGPSWRSRVKLETHGRLVAPTPTPRQTIPGADMQDPRNWTPENTAARPNPGYPDYDATHPNLWGVSAERTEIYGVPGQDYVVNGSDEDAPLGLNLQGCYDFLQGETWSVGLNLRFAGYWNMKSESRGRYNAGGTYTQNYRDWFLFDNVYTGNFATDVDSSLGDRPTINGGSDMTDSYVDRGSHVVNTRLRSDLYQIGLGPKVTWSPFVGWCEWMEWLDVYGGVEVLCNLAHTEFDADGSSSSQTDCLLGFGGNVGLVGNITDNIGIYGQVGYEWVDSTDVSTGGFKADIDYSSLVLSAGVQVRF